MEGARTRPELTSENNLTDRLAMINQFKRTPVLSVEEIAQMISLRSRPADRGRPRQLRTGKPVPIKKKDAGVYRRTTLPATGHANGLDYLSAAPSRSTTTAGRTRCSIVLTHAGINPEDVIAAPHPRAPTGTATSSSCRSGPTRS